MKSSKLALAAIPALPATFAALSSDAQGQILYTDLGPTGVTVTASSNQRLYFDLDHSGDGPAYVTLAAPGAGPSGKDFSLTFGISNPSPPTKSSAKPSLFNENAGVVLTEPAGRITKFAPGAAIAYSPYHSPYALFSSNGDNPTWASGTRGFVGLSLTTDASANFGWADVSYNSDESLTLYGFAYEQSGGAIEAGATGAVPEPSTYAAMAGLLAGSAALYRRRQQKKLAATAAT